MNDDQQQAQGQTPTPQGMSGQDDQVQGGEEEKKGRYTVKVIRDKCIGAASCIAVAPQTFKLDDENKAIILAQKMDSDENLLLSAQSCPTAAIIVTDDETGEQIWPKTLVPASSARGYLGECRDGRFRPIPPSFSHVFLESLEPFY